MRRKLLMAMIMVLNLVGSQAMGTSYYSGYYYVDYELNEDAFLYNSTIFEVVDGGHMDSFWAHDNSRVTMSGGLVWRSVRAYDNVEIDMSGGNIMDSLYGYQTSHIDMSGGSVSGLLLSGYDSQIDLSGGTVGEAIRVLNNGRIDIFGLSFTVYSDDYVDGVQLQDGDNLLEYATLARYPNGYYYHSCQIVGTLADCSSMDNIVQINNIKPWAGSANIYVHIVPKPALAVPIDIKPGSCPNPLNVKSSGVLPVAILGSEDVNVTEIDVATILLEGVSPIRSALEDVATPVTDVNDCNCTTDGPDGFLDLALKFRIQEIVATLGEVNHGDELTLTLEGALLEEFCGTLIYGADCVTIRGRHKPFNAADINKDGVVDMADFAIFSENWLQSSIVED